MPSFGSPFSGFTSEHKLTHEELVRAVRFIVASEYEATQLYTQLADSIDHRLRLGCISGDSDSYLSNQES
jgi:hypothetical protein